VGTNIGTQGIEVSWSAASDTNWISFYEILKDGSAIGKSAKGSFFFDHSPDARNGIMEKYEVRTVDGDGNKSQSVVAQAVLGDPETHQPLGEFWPIQGRDGWKYEESFDGQTYKDLTWQSVGYEGLWVGSGLGRIGRIWTQPSATTELARTFVAARACSVSISGQLQKDPSADLAVKIFVRIMHNHEQIWPASGWEIVPVFGDPMLFEVGGLPIRQGDAIRFVVRRNDEERADPIIWNPVIVLE